MHEQTRCLVCGSRHAREIKPASENWERMLKSAKHYSATDNDFNIHSAVLKCRSCGLVYLKEHLDRTLLVRQYRNTLDRVYPGQEKERSRTFAMYLRRVRGKVKRGSLLEIGSYYGFFLKLARKAGYETVGIEPNRAACRYSREKLGLDVINRNIESASFRKKFDAIVLFDAIEHFFDPLDILKRCAKWQKKGGYIFLTTSDIGTLSARIQGKKWYSFRQQHLYYFNRKTLKKLLEKAGYRMTGRVLLPHHFKLGYLLGQARSFLAPAAERLGLAGLPVRINLFDHMFVSARK